MGKEGLRHRNEEVQDEEWEDAREENLKTFKGNIFSHELKAH